MSYHPEWSGGMISLNLHLRPVVFGPILILFDTELIHLFTCSSRYGFVRLIPNIIFVLFLLISTLFRLPFCINREYRKCSVREILI